MRERKIYRIGIDAGATKSLFTVEFQSTKRRAVFIGGPLNICSISKDEAARTLSQLLSEIKKEFGADCEGIGIGTAGISNPETAPFYRRVTGEVFPSARTVICSDAKAALFGAHNRGEGMILIAGTGSVCYGEHNGESWFSGGGGHILDDGGSGYMLGKEILISVLQEQDNRKTRSLLSALLFHETGIQTREELISFVYSKQTGKKEIAALSKLIVEACESGDKTAIGIIQKAAWELLVMAIAVYEKLYQNENADLALSGSVLEKNRFLRNEVARLLKNACPKITIIKPAENASCGALYIL